MSHCVKCGSHAINDGQVGRERGRRLDLCDVCYWRAEAAEARAKALKDAAKACGKVYRNHKKTGLYPSDMGGLANECADEIRALANKTT